MYMNRLAVFAFFISLVGLVVIINPMSAMADFQFGLQASVTNPDSEVASNASAVFAVPSCPVSVSSASGSWDAGSQTLTVALGNVGPGETRTINADVVTDSSDCLVGQQITGELVSEGQSSETIEPPVKTLPPEELPATEPSLPSAQDGVGGNVNIDFLPQQATQLLEGFRSIPGAISVVENILTPVAVTTNVVSVAVLAASTAAATSHLIFGWIDTLRYLLFLSLRHKKRNPWGQLVNEWTDQPVQGAAVAIIESQFQKIKESQLTDSGGRFGFLVAPGNYYLRIQKSGFVPKMTEVFSVGQNPEQLNLKITLLQSGASIPPLKQKFIKLVQGVNNFFYAINPYLLFFGTLISLFIFLTVPAKFNLIVLIIYLFMDLLKLILTMRTLKSFGLVIDKESKAPLALSVVRLFNVEKNWLMGTRVTDERGRFNFLLLPGSYYLTCTKDTYSEIKTQPIEFKESGIITRTLELSVIHTPNNN